MLFVKGNLDAISLICIPIFGWLTTFIKRGSLVSATGSIISLDKGWRSKVRKTSTQMGNCCFISEECLLMMLELLPALYWQLLLLTTFRKGLLKHCGWGDPLCYCFFILVTWFVSDNDVTWHSVCFCLRNTNNTDPKYLWRETPQVKFTATFKWL